MERTKCFGADGFLVRHNEILPLRTMTSVNPAQYMTGEPPMQEGFSLRAKSPSSTPTMERQPPGRKVGCAARCSVAGSPGFYTEFVVYSYSQTLLAADMAFCGLHRYMPEEKLDLLKLASRIVAELSQSFRDKLASSLRSEECPSPQIACCKSGCSRPSRADPCHQQIAPSRYP